MAYKGRVRPTIALTAADIAADAVGSSEIADDAVTTDKLANAINTSIAANTAKVTNATHTGDVTGATALTIASGAVDIAMLSATGTASATTYLRGDNAWSAIAGGLSGSSQWRLTTDFTGDAAPIAANFEEVDTDGYGRLGSAMTESSGVFSFPSTGIWLIIAHLECEYNGASDYNVMTTNTTVDDGTWTVATSASNLVRPASGYGQIGCTSFFQFDVTNVSTHKVRFAVDVQTAGTTVMGNSNINETHFTFTKLGDT